MKLKTFIKTAALIMAVAVSTAALSGCGVSKSEFNSLKERVDALEEIHGSDILDDSPQNAKTPKSTPKSTADKSRSEEKDDENSASDDKFDSDKVGEDIEVEEYDYIDSDNKKFAFFIFNNGSDFDVDANVKIECKDSGGKSLGDDEKDLINLESGQRSYLGFELDPDTETIVRTVRYDESSLRGTRLSDINARAARAQGGVNVTVANIGRGDADGLKYLVLFFDGNKLVGFDSSSLPEIFAGQNTTVPAVCYEDFDRADVFLAIDN